VLEFLTHPANATLVAGLTVAGTGLSIAGVLAFARRQNRRARAVPAPIAGRPVVVPGRPLPVSKPAEAPAPLDAAPIDARAATAPPIEEDLLARYVRDEEGNLVGETLQVRGDEVVLKQGARFFVVPRGAVSVKGPDLLASDVDWEEAEAAGEAWLEKRRDVLRYDDDGLPVSAEKPE